MQVRVPALAGALGALLALGGATPAAGAPVSAAGPAAGSSPAATATVSIVLKDGKIGTSATSVSAGKITFVVNNAGKTKHSLVVIRSDRHHHLLDVQGTRASEVGVAGRIKPFASGSTQRLTLTLAPGKYVVICNDPGHYKKGEYLAFTVKPTTATTPAQTTDVNVSLFEMGFKLSKLTVPHGTVVFHLRNDGKLPHDFSFGSRGGGSPMLDPGATATLTVKFATAGKYTFICTVEGHYAAGMSGVLTVS